MTFLQGKNCGISHIASSWKIKDISYIRLLALGVPFMLASAGLPSRPSQCGPAASRYIENPSQTNYHSKVSVCDAYSAWILSAASPENRHFLMTLFVNIPLLGIHITPKIRFAVNGITGPEQWT